MSVSSTSSRQRAPLMGRRILVVEDEYFLADDIGNALRKLGAEIAGPVGHIEDAVEMLHNGGALDAAVLDVNIRAQSIFPIARELRARQVPFVFTTGYDRLSIETEFRDVQLWEKPIDIVAMAQNLASLVRGQPHDTAQPRHRSEQMRESKPGGDGQA
ncbi:chemotaxis protein CheY [Bradyrhizobium nanningense]|uniref:Chemotaxis protein CheY n=1 Tax=Bradyrhizobium nanningense TaxID=1325118 RepID=A0A4Q0S0D8_9BRAD|nr:response regulator [Bradyrhizobium nanningense]RXH25215.1 chemotaxis protein CheY [Bradyrhizobium nanningense]RXH27226.1 chemotaxis protein CheY [Bradyrhizobium nanningense]